MRNHYLIWQFLLFESALLLLGYGSAQAASFDCKKAKTETERAICASAELSKQDEELAKFYREVLSKPIKAQDKKVLQKEQREWPAIRDQYCTTDENCLKKRYADRINELKKTPQQTPPASTVAESLKGSATALITYPDVWSWSAPKGRSLGGVFVSKDGKVWIFHGATKDRDNRNARYEYVDFFTGHPAIGTRPEPDNPDRNLTSIALTSGVRLGTSSPDMRSGKCYDRLEGMIIKRSGNPEKMERKVLLYLYDRPQKFTVRENCTSMDGHDFTFRVESAFAYLLKLNDGTFLVVDIDHGVIIRFDENWNTKSTLIGRRVFLWNRDELEELFPPGSFETQDWQDAVLKRVLQLSKRNE